MGWLPLSPAQPDWETSPRGGCSMSLRSHLILMAALVLAPTMLPMLVHAPAQGQDAGAATAEPSDDSGPSQLDKKTIRKRIKALRQAIKSGNLTREERRQAKAKIKAYRS